jgi:hypothetical protein
MKIKHLFVLFVVVLHTIFLVLSLHLLQQSPWLFLTAEAGIIGSIVLSAVIYRQFVRPLDLIASGIESIRDKDFGMSSTFFYRSSSSRHLRGLSPCNWMVPYTP